MGFEVTGFGLGASGVATAAREGESQEFQSKRFLSPAYSRRKGSTRPVCVQKTPVGFRHDGTAPKKTRRGRLENPEFQSKRSLSAAYSSGEGSTRPV